jgi:hypothetical protein
VLGDELHGRRLAQVRAASIPDAFFSREKQKGFITFAKSFQHVDREENQEAADRGRVHRLRVRVARHDRLQIARSCSCGIVAAQTGKKRDSYLRQELKAAEDSA